MKPKWILLIGMMALTAAAVWMGMHRTAKSDALSTAWVTPVAEPAATSSPPEKLLASTLPASPADQSPTLNGTPPTNALAGKPQKSPSKTSNVASANKRELLDPLAREALSLVGADPEAESYWIDAIYDTSLPDKEREDLMEDLNEDGLSDPKRPGPQDLPLILNRLAIIEELAPNADEFMLRHLGEAYKDLVNLAAITQGSGQPVR